MRCELRNLRRRARRTAFTLMEVLLVLAILVILGSMVGVFIAQMRSRGFQDAARTQINMFKQPLEAYNLDVGRYPSSENGLESLRTLPPDLTNPNKWRGPYVKEVIPADPWGNPYQYQLISQDPASPMPYRIWSFGANAVNDDGGGDDISS